MEVLLQVVFKSLKMPTELFVVLVIVLILTYQVIFLKLYWKRKRVCSLVLFPIVGCLQMLSLQKSIGDFLWNVHNKGKASLVGFHVCGTPSLLIKDTKLLKRMLVKDFENFSYRPILSTWDYEGDPMGTNMLFLLRGTAWTLMRRKFSSSFTTNRLCAAYSAINTVGDNMVKFVKRYEGVPLETNELFHKFSTDVITTSAFGIEANCFDNEDAMSRTIARKMFDGNFWTGVQFVSYFIWPDFAKAFNMKFIEKNAGDFMYGMIEDIKQFREKNNVQKEDFVGRLLDLLNTNTYVYDKNEIIAQGMQFWSAGFETTGSTIMFLFYELAYNLDIQDKLRDEIERTLKENDGSVSFDIIRNMIYLNMVVTETFRKYPSLPFLDRVCNKDYKIPETDITIDKGTRIYVSLQGVHYDPTNFPDPHKFDPERFDPDKRISSFSTYLTFGDGPRHCIGMRFAKIAVLVCVIKIISNFKVIPVDEYKHMEFDGRAFLLRPKKLVYLKFESLRKQN